MSTITTYKNLLIISLGFFLIHAAFFPIQNIQASLHKDPALGFGSLTALYASAIISSCFLPNLLMAKFKPKILMIISMSTFSLYVFANFMPVMGTIMPAAILFGLSTAVMWTCHSSYVTTIATNHANSLNLPKDPIVSKFFSIFYVLFQVSQILGNGVSSAVLMSVNKDKVKGNVSTFNTSISCGYRYCPSASLVANVQAIPIDTVYKLMGILLGLSLVGILLVIVFLDALWEETRNEQSLMNLCFSTIKHVKSPMILLLVPITIFSGMDQAFVYGDYTKTFVSCSLGIDAIGYSMMCFGAVACLVSVAIGLIVKWTGTYLVMVAGTFLYLGLMSWFLVWNTEVYPNYTFYVGAMGCGFTTAIWMSQSNAIYGVYFPKTQEAAFSIYRLFQNLGFTVSFAYADVLCTSTKIYILMGLIIFSMVLYSIAEFNYRKNVEITCKEKDVVENMNMDEKC
ncbi:protein unc-93 homolog A [Hydra vulgaris]|uniref:protein unc-93 homolog A n=1 Tax=Hydra vulgaris TaxID=6087 RepID=UPI001F5EBD44|nr:protein unc-93 homolog A-like [Hydra vulgaris]